jgi:hypothetical protein
MSMRWLSAKSVSVTASAAMLVVPLAVTGPDTSSRPLVDRTPASSTLAGQSCESDRGAPGSSTGRVQLPDGSPVSGARVAVVNLQEPVTVLACRLTNSKGEYTLPPSVVGTAMVIVDPPSSGAAETGSSSGMRTLPTSAPMDWTLGTADIAGRLTVDAGAPRDIGSTLHAVCTRRIDVPSSQVRIDSCGLLIDTPNGRNFALDLGTNPALTGLQLQALTTQEQPAGKARYFFAPIPGPDRRLDTQLSMTTGVAAGGAAAPCAVSTLTAGNLSGVVRNAAGAPVANARVELVEPNAFPAATAACVLTRGDGTYVIDTSLYQTLQSVRPAPGMPGPSAPLPWECSSWQGAGCLPEDRQYLVIVDPPSGSAPSVGSSGGLVATAPGAIRNWTLGPADLTGRITVGGSDWPDGVLTACLLGPAPQSTAMVCGRAVMRSDGLRRYAIDAPDGLADGTPVGFSAIGFYTAQLAAPVPLPAGQSARRLDHEFGNTQVAGIVWADRETRAGSVVLDVERMQAGSFVRVTGTTTSGDGFYVLSGLADGEYRIVRRAPDRCNSSQPQKASSCWPLTDRYLDAIATFSVVAGAVALGTGFEAGSTPLLASIRIPRGNVRFELREGSRSAELSSAGAWPLNSGSMFGNPPITFSLGSDFAVGILPNGVWAVRLTSTSSPAYPPGLAKVTVEGGVVTAAAPLGSEPAGHVRLRRDQTVEVRALRRS